MEKPLSTELSSENVSEQDDPREKKLSVRDVFIIASVLLMTFLFSCAYSLLAPFFPKEAAKKGVNTTVVGVIFGCYEFVLMIFSPLVGMLLKNLNVVPKYLYIAASLLGVVTTTLYGFLDMTTDGTFTALCLVLRITDAIACATATCCSITMLTSLYPNSISILFGAGETVVGVGYMTGPALGGALYQAGGFGLPFFVVGGLMLLGVFAPMFLVPKQSKAADKVQENTPPMWRILTRPVLLMSCLASLFGAICITFQYPVLQKHLEQFHLSTGLVGLLFIIAAGVYALVAPFSGIVIDKWSCGRTSTFVGVLLLSVVNLLFGPSPIFQTQAALWMTALGLFGQGLVESFAVVPGFSLMLEDVKKIGFPDSVATNGLVSGIVLVPYYLGSGVGPIIAGALNDSVGYAWANTIVSLIGLVVTIIIGITFAILKYQRRPLSEMETPIIADDKDDQLNESSHILKRKTPTYSSHDDKP